MFAVLRLYIYMCIDRWRLRSRHIILRPSLTTHLDLDGEKEKSKIKTRRQ